MSEWRKDAMPMNGTPICVRAVSTYRYQPYKPNSEQRKRGINGRWQEVRSEYGGWINCEAPVGDGWMLAKDWSPSVSIEDPAAFMEEVRDDARSICINLAALIDNPSDDHKDWRISGAVNEADKECVSIALRLARALLAKLERTNG